MSYGFEDFKSDIQEAPLAYPLLRAYGWLLSIRRYEHFPFYIYPQGMKVSSIEDGVIKFVDYMVDAHELERNKMDDGMNFYNRANYVSTNFLRYSNDTMANCMFEEKLHKNHYDRLNSVMHMSQLKYYGTTTLTHFTILAYMSYFFRYRCLNKL